LRIYVIGESEEEVDSAVELISNKGAIVVAKEVNSFEHLKKEVEASIDKGLVVVIPKDPIKANITLNKLENVNAAQCSNADEVRLALYNNANVIIMSKPSNKEEVLFSLMGEKISSTTHEEHAEAAKASRKKVKAEEIIEKVDEVSIEEDKSREESNGGGEEAELKNVEGEEQGRRKGFLGFIKDALGITDKR
jgi:ribose 5-phosphate isomerase RpiB